MNILQTIQEHFVVERVAGGTSIAFSDLTLVIAIVLYLTKAKIKQLWQERRK